MLVKDQTLPSQPWRHAKHTHSIGFKALQFYGNTGRLIMARFNSKPYDTAWFRLRANDQLVIENTNGTSKQKLRRMKKKLLSVLKESYVEQIEKPTYKT